jgi:GTP-binding protein Era
MKKFFSEMTRVKKFVPVKQLRDIKDRQLKLEKNKLFDGINPSNTNELGQPKDREIFYPIQHPKNVNNADYNIISYQPPPLAMTEYHRIPSEALVFKEPEFESPLDSKHLDIGILGPPNAGKSSLMNLLIDKNVSAVSGKYGTTYDKIEGIYTDINNRIQLVFKDTPGAIKVSKSIRSKLISTRAWTIIPECDQLLFVIDAVKHLDTVTNEAIKRLLAHKYKPSLLKVMNKFKNSNPGDDVSIEQVEKIMNESNLDDIDHEPRSISTVLVMNKVDLVVNKRKVKRLQEELEDLGAFDKVFHVSCNTGYGIEGLKEYLKSKAIRRNWRYHPEVKSTQSEVEKCEEILKQIIFNRFYEELPYNTNAIVTSWVPMTNGELKISFQVEVKSAINISMFVGQQGRTIGEIRKELDKQLTQLFQRPVKCIINVVHRNRRKIEELSQINDKPV